MYWFQKLDMMELSNNDIETHIDEMQGVYDHLSSLITVDNPLTADDYFETALLVPLPSNWLSCVSSLLQETRTSSTQIVTTLKAEVLCQKAANLHNPINLTAALVKVASKSQSLASNSKSS